MKIFRTVRKLYAILGIDSPNQSLQERHFSKREIFGLSSIGCLIISQFVYIFYVASSFMGYMEAICAISLTTILFVSFATIILKKTVLFELYDRIENLIDTSEAIWIENSKFYLHIRFKTKIVLHSGCEYPASEALFFETNQQVEKFTEIILMLFTKIILHCLVLSKCAVSFGVYFITDVGSDSFQLPFPMWWVSIRKNIGTLHEILRQTNEILHSCSQKVSIRSKQSHRIFGSDHFGILYS